jgi:hypothetical protein
MSSPSPASLQSARRRRALITLGAISIGWKVVVFTLGAAVPRWFIDDGLGLEGGRGGGRHGLRNLVGLCR